jgi:endoglucanase
MKNKAVSFKSAIAVLLCMLGACISRAQAWQSDNGDGTFTNPVLYADYPDPDIIRVGSDFYMVTTTFVNSPGIVVSHSKDMVNWETIGQVASSLDWSGVYNMTSGTTAYANGFWASSIRYYNGTYYVVANPTGGNGRVYYASNPAGPWNYYTLSQGIYDPGFFIDDDGTGYIFTGGSPQSILRLSADFSTIVSSSNSVVASGGEGSHVIKTNGYYYLFNANPGIWPYQLLCARATNIYGPWETGHEVLNEVSGGHQGAILQLADGSWYGFAMKDEGAAGRMPRIGPVYWSGNWPVFGTVSAQNQFPATATKPVAGQTIMQPATSDTFSSSTLGLQWMWNHNPDNTRWSLTERAGYLRLRPTQASGFWTARNTLTQKGQGPQSNGVVKLDLTNLQAGDIAGFGTLGATSGHIYVTTGTNGSRYLNMEVLIADFGRNPATDTRVTSVPFAGTTLYLRTDLDFNTGLGACSYSSDGNTWTTLGGSFTLAWGATYQGEQFSVFCYNPNTASSAGYVDVDAFTFTANNASQVVAQRARPQLNAARTTFVADNGHNLRGPYTSTEWTTATSYANIVAMKNLGFNTIHLYAESFDPAYVVTSGTVTAGTAPGYNMAEVDKIVAESGSAGMYLVMTIGNGAYNGNHNAQWAHDFWALYAPRYANQTHVIYEIHNEPMAWGPSYLTGTTPAGALDMEKDCFSVIRANAPNTPVLLFSYAVFGGSGGADAALTDIQSFNTAVFGDANAVWTNEAVGFHGYAGWQGTSQAVAALLAAGYPCMMTEFCGDSWGGLAAGLDAELTSELERLGVSWTTFQATPPGGVSWLVSNDLNYKNIANRAGLSWAPDYGTWPVLRGPNGNGGEPRHTTGVTGIAATSISGTLQIEMEDFDTGGQDVSYHDDATNAGGQYRTAEGVDIEATSDTGGGYDVGWAYAGEWMEYTIWVDEPGFYDMNLRYAATAAATVQITSNNLDKTGSWALASTGGSQTWATAGKQVFLEFGRQKLRVSVTGGNPNMNWVRLSPITTGPITSGTYKLVNANSGMAMQYDATNSAVIQNPYSGVTTQQWIFTHLGAGQYRVQAVSNNDNWNIGGSPGSVMGLTWWWGIDAKRQRFAVRATGDGYYRIAPADSGFDLEVQGASQTSGAKMQTSSGYTGAAQQKWAIQAPSAPNIPAALHTSLMAAGEVDLAWMAASGASSYTVKRATTSGGPYTVIASGLAGTSYNDTSVVAGVMYYYVVSAFTSGVESMNSGELGVLTPWQWQDVGSVGGVGSTTCSGGVFTIKGSGADIWDTADAFHFTYMAVNGDCSIIARVASIQNTDGWAKAGVMIRESLAANAANAYVATTALNGVSWQYRLTAGAYTNNINVGGLSAPYWVKLVRSGSTFTGYRSADGASWTQTGSTTISMGTTVYMGLATTSHNNSLLTTATFDYVTTVPDWQASTSVSTGPAAPTGLAATAGNTIVSLSWTISDAATSYNVMRATANGGPYTTLQGVGGTNFTDTGLTNGTTYYYVVTAQNADGVSANSAQASATPSSSSVGYSGTSTAAVDGYIRASSSTNTAGGSIYATTTPSRLGDDSSNRQYKGLVSFDTSTLPAGATIASATVKIKQSASTGTPFTSLGTCYLDIKRGGFNGNTSLEAADFTATADATQVATMSNPGSNGAWSTGSLNATGLALINRSGVTQLRVYFLTATDSDGGNDYISWYTGDDATASNRPVLEVSYSIGSGSLQRAWLKFDEAGGTSAEDATGNGWTGTLVNGPAWTTGTLGNAASLDGVDDHVTLPGGVVSGLSDFTMSAWVKLSGTSVWARIFDFGTGTTNYMFLTANNGSVPRFAIRTASVGEQVIDGNAALPTGVWTHVAVTMAGPVGTLYVNGVASGSNANMGLVPALLGSTTLNYIGKSQFGADAYLSAAVDDVRIYSTALSAANIAALMAPPAGPTGVTATGGDGNVALSWNAVSGATYTVKRATASGGPYTTLVSSYAGLTYADFSVANGTTYYYVVTAVSGAIESSASTQVSAVPAALPAVPTGLTATGTNAAVSLNWTASSGATSYNVKRSTTSGTGYATVATGVATTSHSDAGLSASTTYYYVVSAVNAAGESANSTQASATTLAPAPAITSTLTKTGTNGSAFSYTITASNSPTSYGATGLPTGLSVNTGSGIISGTPTVTGTFAANITASNAIGTGSAALTITVLPPASGTPGYFTQDAQGLTLQTTSGGVTRVEVWGDRIARVLHAPTAAIPAISSLAVSGSPAATSWQVQDNGSYLLMTTPALRIRIDSPGGRVWFSKPDGTAILSESSAGTALSGTTVGSPAVPSYIATQGFDITSSEAVYGLGQHGAGLMNYRGSSVHLQQQNASESAIPVLVSSQGYGLFWDNPAISDVSVAQSSATNLTWTSEAADAVNYYFCYGPELDDVVGGYRKLTGDAPMFGKWAWGLWQSKNRYQSQDELLSVVNTYRGKSIPLDNVIQDWQYWGPNAWGSHVFNSTNYPDVPGLMNTLHATNAHMIISVWARFDPGIANANALTAVDGLYPQVLPDALGGVGQWYDPFNASARQVYWSQISQRLFSTGIDGWWFDGSEGEFGGNWGEFRNFNTAAGPGAKVFNAYPLMHTTSAYQGQRAENPNKRVFILTRSAYAGQQRNAAVTWSGDIGSNWTSLANQIPAGLNFSVSGVPYWNTDTGGFWDNPATDPAYAEIFTRWFQFSTFCPMLRIHGNNAKEIWRFPGVNQSALINYDKLRYHLLPYIYSTSWQVTSAGYTMMRPLVMDFRTDGNVFGIKDQYMFGPSLMPCPVTSPGVTARNVYLPAGTVWYDFWTGATNAGGQAVSAAAPIDKMPIFVRAGSVLPMGPDIQYAAQNLDPMEIRVYPGANGSFNLYEDEGDNYNYESGVCATIPFTWNNAIQQLTIGARQGSFPGMLASRTFRVVFVRSGQGVGLNSPADVVVTYNGSQLTVTQPSLPAVPAAPGGLAASSGSSQVSLTWTATGGDVVYKVKRALQSGGPYTTIASELVGTSYADMATEAGTTYYYVVTAVNAGGEGPASAEASAKTASSLQTLLMFNEISGTTAGDASGNGWHGTLVNGPLSVAGKGGNAVALDGTNDYVSLPSGVAGALHNFTISTWVKLTSTNAWSRIFDFGTGTTNYMFLSANGNALRFAIRTPSVGEQVIDSSVSLTIGTWTHVAVTLSGSTGTLYVNGVATGTNSAMTLTPSSLGSTTLNYIGKSQFADPYFNGSVDDFRVYAGNLSPAEILALANGTASALASPWASQDIGTLVTPGSSGSPIGDITVTASGDDIQSSSDNFHYAWRPLNGDGTLTARVAALTSIDSWTKTGIMFRDSLNANASTAFIAITPGNGTTFQNRSTAGAGTGWSAIVGPAAPYWLRLQRAGNVFTPYQSVDGVNWSQSGAPVTLALPTNAYVGFALTAHSGTTGTLAVARFDNITLSNPALAAPTGLTATGSNAAVSLSWTAVSGATGYNVKRSTTSGTGYTTVATGVAATSYSDTGLTNGMTYYYMVAATNANGDGINSSEVNATPALPPAPVITSTLSKTGTNGSSFSYTITAGNSPTSYGATGLPTGLSVNTGSGLINGTPTVTGTFVASISASNAIGTGSAALIITLLPAAPTVLTATGSSGFIALSWSASSGAASYNVKRSTMSGSGYMTIASGMTATSYNDTFTASGTTYYYVVSAVSVAGESANSTEASARLSVPISTQEMQSPQITIAGGNANATVKSSVLGHAYQLQYRDDLASGSWQNYGSAQAGTGGDLTLTMPVDSLTARRFYRVLIQQ